MVKSKEWIKKTLQIDQIDKALDDLSRNNYYLFKIKHKCFIKTWFTSVELEKDIVIDILKKQREKLEKEVYELVSKEDEKD